MLDHTREQYDFITSIGEVLHEASMIAGICFVIGVVLTCAAVFGGVQ